MNETNSKPNGSAAVSPTLNRIRDGLEKSRKSIKTLSDEIADKDLEAIGLQDSINIAYSSAFVQAATEVGENGKLINPNLDSQKSATVIKLADWDKYSETVEKYRKLLNEIQKKKNEITCEHERRGDLKSEIDLLRLLKEE
jgi:predicted transcriptional regulator